MSEVLYTSFDISTLIDTLDFAAKKHSRQKRKDREGTPYINHPIGVAKNLIDAGITDLVTIQAAILHDTVEDTDTTFEEIESKFGNEVKNVVEEVTDDKLLPYEERKRLQIVHTPHISVKAKVVKLADKLYNLRDLQRSVPVNWTEERVQEYFIWSKQVTDGAKGINQKLDDQLEDLYQNGTFEFNNITYKSYPKQIK
ncbi:guanosine-3,5-bisdiphosphate 3-pyrophosphohydrolase MESH1 [Gigaspora margarita]|uniref:Guanosine-3',5'-bis(diphosphate) 3'-pyrophosphohydrolase MESH1 n=1 Tax=Gigaspora margarita TaxID=4874 RepID=A0A8H3XL87_GIGMA|nr:guanosine-3,5-bisdiphosphate 3-pyrophosphohydrolase MESH1 [Gigaspora margarita]